MGHAVFGEVRVVASGQRLDMSLVKSRRRVAHASSSGTWLAKNPISCSLASTASGCSNDKFRFPNGSTSMLYVSDRLISDKLRR